MNEIENTDQAEPVFRRRLHRSAAEVAVETLAEIELHSEFPELRGFHTGIHELDKELSPGLRPGRLLLIAGDSGGFKTALANQIAVAMAAQVPVALASLEDETHDTMKRQLANLARENVGSIRAGFGGHAGVPKSIYDAAESYDTLQLSYLDPDDHTVEGVARAAQAWAKDVELPAVGGVLIVDQMSHLVQSDPALAAYFMARKLPMPPPLGAPERDILEWQAWFFRILAVRLNLLVILIHQLNETHGTGRPNKSSIRGSRGLVHKSDAVLIPWCPERIPNPFAGPGEPATVPNDNKDSELIIVKGRTVQTAIIPVRADGAHQRFAPREEASTTPYQRPKPMSARAQEGALKLAALHAKFEQNRLESVPPPAQPAIDAVAV